MKNHPQQIQDDFPKPADSDLVFFFAFLLVLDGSTVDGSAIWWLYLGET